MAVEECDWSLEPGLTTYWPLPLRTLVQPLHLQAGGTAAFRYPPGIDARTLPRIRRFARTSVCFGLFMFCLGIFETRSYLVLLRLAS